MAMIDQHYLSAFVECFLSLTVTAFEILNLQICLHILFVTLVLGGIGIINLFYSRVHGTICFIG